MDGACSTHRRLRNAFGVLEGKSEEKKLLGTYGRRVASGVKADFR
jgi:hypothetical protein